MARSMFAFFQYVLLVFCLSCTTTPVTGSKKLILTSRSQENAMGAKAYQEILKKERLDNSSALAQQVKVIGARLAKSADRPDFAWEFNVFQSEDINAFCLPGGKVGFYSGMAKVANNPARLAAVLAHEIGHALARHGGQRISASLGQELLLAILSVTALSELSQDKRNLTLAALGIGTSVGILLPFSRDNEAEADEIGIILMAAAGFDPRESVVLWQRMEEISGKSGPSFLSTHPSHQQRQKNLTALLPRAMAIYERRNSAQQ